MIFNLYKERGETPLECVQRFREKFPEYDQKKPLDREKTKWTYMGRLDPMAEGVLLVASGEDVYKKEEFLEFDKEYDFVALFGFATDTYDILGKVVRAEKVEDIKEMELIKLCKVYEGERMQKYPEYSSKMIASRKTPSPTIPRRGRESGNPLPSEGGRGEVPIKKITIHKIQFHGLDQLNSKELFGRLLMDIGKVKGDFRQNEILILWRQMLLPKPSLVVREGLHDSERVSYLARFSAHVSSGTYIRSIVNDFGNTLGYGATTLSIRRTRAGSYKIEDSIKF